MGYSNQYSTRTILGLTDQSAADGSDNEGLSKAMQHLLGTGSEMPGRVAAMWT